MKLHLGVLDVSYSEHGRPTTTGDVAEILEERYGVMETFAELYESQMADIVVGDLLALVEAQQHGAPPPINEISMSKIDHLFRDYLDRGEWEQKSGNTATMAAQRGVSHRKKRPYVAKNKMRPSFIDTGTYQRSFRAWVGK